MVPMHRQRLCERQDHRPRHHRRRSNRRRSARSTDYKNDALCADVSRLSEPSPRRPYGSRRRAFCYGLPYASWRGSNDWRTRTCAPPYAEFFAPPIACCERSRKRPLQGRATTRKPPSRTTLRCSAKFENARPIFPSKPKKHPLDAPKRIRECTAIKVTLILRSFVRRRQLKDSPRVNNIFTSVTVRT